MCKQVLACGSIQLKSFNDATILQVWLCLKQKRNAMIKEQKKVGPGVVLGVHNCDTQRAFYGLLETNCNLSSLSRFLLQCTSSTPTPGTPWSERHLPLNEDSPRKEKLPGTGAELVKDL